MVKRSNHYEAAFAQFLHDRQAPFVAVDEHRRALMADASLKSLDFLVPSPSGITWLVDIKGRRFPSGRKRRYWKNWTTHDDLRSMAAWQQLFGPDFRALLVFAFVVEGRRLPVLPEWLYRYQGRDYAFLGVGLEPYAQSARRISPKWDTWAVPTRQFRELALPFQQALATTASPLLTAAAPVALPVPADVEHGWL